MSERNEEKIIEALIAALNVIGASGQEGTIEDLERMARDTGRDIADLARELGFEGLARELEQAVDRAFPNIPDEEPEPDRN